MSLKGPERKGRLTRPTEGKEAFGVQRLDGSNAMKTACAVRERGLVVGGSPQKLRNRVWHEYGGMRMRAAKPSTSVLVVFQADPG